MKATAKVGDLVLDGGYGLAYRVMKISELSQTATLQEVATILQIEGSSCAYGSYGRSMVPEGEIQMGTHIRKDHAPSLQVIEVGKWYQWAE